MISRKDYESYDHESYRAAALLEWYVLGHCPIGEKQEGDSAGYTPCGRFRMNGIYTHFRCEYLPGGESWGGGHRCSPMWVKHYNMKRKE